MTTSLRSTWRGVAAVGTLAVLVAGCSTSSGTATSQAGTSSAATSAAAGASSGTASLVFPKDSYTTKTTTVTTSDGASHQITYRLYSSITYVSKPVDATYESMNVEVPVSIDGKSVDASSAPIVFNIPVGGYMSATASGGMGGAPAAGGGAPSGGAPAGGGAAPSGAAQAGGMPGAGQSGAGNTDLALAAGYVVVTAGARGRDNVSSSGTYYGKAPAAIVDLKAAVRYIHYNKGVFPGNTDWIISTGTSAGGALSALLGASGGSSLYEADLQAIGAADASDTIFAVAAYCPITDLEHADAIYEWTFGTLSAQSGTVDKTVSAALAAEFPAYIASLGLKAPDGTTLTADNYADYMVTDFLEPAATTYLAALSDSARTTYLSSNSWITWANGKATFSWADFLTHLATRKKTAPAFDALDLSAAENIEFGDATTNARHFTAYGLRKATGDSGATISSDLQTIINMMNPMYFIENGNSGSAKHWFLRTGTSDTDTSPAVLANLSATLLNHGDDVDALMYWDAGHGANNDPTAFIAWIAKETGYSK